jgi:HlyD family secretion protein
MKTVIVLTVLMVVGASGGAYWYWADGRPPKVAFRTAVVERGELRATISATGTIEPEEVVDIGAQVVGIIQKFGPDPRDPSKSVDYGTPVEANGELAQIDNALYRARVDRAMASVEQAKAEVKQSDADLKRSQADLLQLNAKSLQAERDWERSQRLYATQAIAQAEYESSEAAHAVATANVEVGEAMIKQAEAALDRAKKSLLVAEADFREAQKNLDYTTIRSPVKGVVVDRRVNVGQTVVASLNAPSLFLIAKDLRRLQVWASVNEADIGMIRAREPGRDGQPARPGQPVRFTVDAFPNEEFHGEVIQIRYNATMTNNVVSYTVVVETDNSSGKLLPYLTANLQFEIERHENMLLVPNAALRFRPQPQQVVADAREAFAQANRRREAVDARKGTPTGAEGRRESSTLWVEESGLLRPIQVRAGLSDGSVTEIVSGDVREGMAVVIGEAPRKESGGTESSNPFLPRVFKGGGSKGPPQ